MNNVSYAIRTIMILHRSLHSAHCLLVHLCMSHNKNSKVSQFIPKDSLQFLSQIPTMKLNLSLHLLFVVMTFNPNVVDATDEFSPGLRGSNKRDHFSNDDTTINNSPISFELLGFNEEDPNVYVRGRGLMTRDYFSNDDLTINSPTVMNY